MSISWWVGMEDRMVDNKNTMNKQRSKVNRKPKQCRPPNDMHFHR